MKPASSSHRSRRKRTALGRRLVGGLKDALAHARGELVLTSYIVTTPAGSKTP
jgi:hypothetical protein